MRKHVCVLGPFERVRASVRERPFTPTALVDLVDRRQTVVHKRLSPSLQLRLFMLATFAHATGHCVLGGRRRLAVCGVWLVRALLTACSPGDGEDDLSAAAPSPQSTDDAVIQASSQNLFTPTKPVSQYVLAGSPRSRSRTGRPRREG